MLENVTVPWCDKCDKFTEVYEYNYMQRVSLYIPIVFLCSFISLSICIYMKSIMLKITWVQASQRPVDMILLLLFIAIFTLLFNVLWVRLKKGWNVCEKCFGKVRYIIYEKSNPPVFITKKI